MWCARGNSGVKECGIFLLARNKGLDGANGVVSWRGGENAECNPRPLHRFSPSQCVGASTGMAFREQNDALSPVMASFSSSSSSFSCHAQSVSY